jgi:hypothetical protein
MLVLMRSFWVLTVRLLEYFRKFAGCNYLVVEMLTATQIDTTAFVSRFYARTPER